MKFLHMADLHLGRSLALEDGAKREASREDRFRTLKSALDLVRTQGLDALILAGDIIEGDLFSLQDAYRFLDLLEGLAPAQVHFVLGNHDYRWGAYVDRVLSWPENVHVFPQEEVGHFDLEDKGVRFLGQSWSDTARTQTLELGPDDLRPGFSHVLVHHGLFGGRDYFPIDPQAPWVRDLDYIALGHVHSYQAWEGRIVNPGTPEPLALQDTGDRYIVLGGMGPGGVRLDKTSLQARTIRELQVPLGDQASFRKHQEEVKGLIKSPRDIYKISWQGARPAPDLLSALEAWLEEGVFYASFDEDFDLDLDLARLKEDHQGDLLGHFIKRMEDQGLDRGDNRAILYLGLEALLKSGGAYDI